MRATGLVRLPPSALASFLTNPASCIDMATAGLAKPLCFHSPRVRISTSTISPLSAAASASGADIIPDDANAGGAAIPASKDKPKSAILCRRVKFMAQPVSSRLEIFKSKFRDQLCAGCACAVTDFILTRSCHANRLSQPSCKEGVSCVTQKRNLFPAQNQGVF